MIDPGYVRLMARYNRWQNDNLYGAAETLSPEARLQDRGAFFGSIQGTLNHLLWADGVWMSRFAGWPRPVGGIAESRSLTPDWETLRRERATIDADLIAWAEARNAGDLAGDHTWYSGAAGREVSKPVALLVMHMFNHQTHHRGQVHAMLTAAGARPGDTDLFFLDADA